MMHVLDLEFPLLPWRSVGRTALSGLDPGQVSSGKGWERQLVNNSHALQGGPCWALVLA